MRGWKTARLGIGVWLLLALALAVTVQAQDSGVLEGRVVNGTDGGPDVGEGVTVTLRIFENNAEVDVLETTTAAKGRFRFEGLNMDSAIGYWPEAVYQGVTFSSAESYQFAGDQTTLEAALTVYETTDDDSAVRLDAVHLIIESFGEVLRVSEIHLFGNRGDRAYVGRAGDDGQATTVHIPLPEGATGLSFHQNTAEGRFVEVEGGLLDTEPVPPGEETMLVFFSYHVMVAGETIPLERRFDYPVTLLNVLVAQPGLVLRSDQLQAQGPQSFQGQQYDFYLAEDLAPDTPLVLELTPVEAPAAPEEAVSPHATVSTPTRGNQELLLWLGLGLAGLAVMGAVVYPLITAGEDVASEVAGADLVADPQARRLLAELADLEGAFEAGEVDEATYERQRAAKYKAIKAEVSGQDQVWSG